MPTGGRARGDAARERIVREAAALATVVGLGGLTIGVLAHRLEMPKSSLYVLFGSKEELQLETVHAAREVFIARVVVPAFEDGTDGLDRLSRLAEAFLDYVEQRAFPGGCFFVQAAAELGGQRGAVHDLVVTYQAEWRQLLIGQARIGLATDDSPERAEQLAFELGALLSGANLLAVLHDDDRAIERARIAVHRLLGPSTRAGGS